MFTHIRVRKLTCRIPAYLATSSHLPYETVAKEFVALLPHEVTQLHSDSERLIVFVGLMLHCDEMVKKGQDIRRLLS